MDSNPKQPQDNRYNQGLQNNGSVTGGNFDQKIIHGPNTEGHINNPTYKDCNFFTPQAGQAPLNSSANSPQPSVNDPPKSSLKAAQQSLKETYLTRFQKVRPFSLPFMFDIENTWVSLALKEEKYAQATEDHAKLLEQAFKKAKMLTIEGEPATGKTSLMRRLAYEWAIQKGEKNRKSKFVQLHNWVRGKFLGQEDDRGIQLLCYDLVLYAEFREVREKTFESIAELVLYYYSKNYITKESYENLKNLVNKEKFCKEYRILVLLDGYDESSLEKQCLELSSYLNGKTINKALLFDTVITTRKGYLSMYRDVIKGRLVFAEVLGFTTMTQKEKYISNHFSLYNIDNKEKISAVHSLLAKNRNLNRLAETPLFLTFICLVYEKIVDGTLVELYCNIIRWLIDRHQQDFPNSDIPALFGFQSDSAQASEPLNEKQYTVQKHYLQFPQLRSLGKMALNNLKNDTFQETDLGEFHIESIIHEVGLIRRDEFYDHSWNLTTTYSFPHRTIQEFLAAYYCFCSNDTTSEWFLPDSKLDTRPVITEYYYFSSNDPISKSLSPSPKLDSSERSASNPSGMNEFERFLFRMALSDKMPLLAEKRKYYFERIAVINLDMTFDAFNTTAGFDTKLLNWFLSQCTNVQTIELREVKGARHERNVLNDTSIHINVAVTCNMSNPPVFSFSNMIKLHSLTFSYCTFSANSQLSFTNCPSLKNLTFFLCEMKSSTIVGITTLPAIHTVQFIHCDVDTASWQAITDQISNSNVKYLHFSANFFVEESYPQCLRHLQKCERIQQIHIYDAPNILNRNEDSVIANLVLTAQLLPALTSITISDRAGGRLDESKRLSVMNKERIEKAGQQRNPHFSLKYVEWNLS